MKWIKQEGQEEQDEYWNDIYLMIDRDISGSLIKQDLLLKYTITKK